MMSEVEKSMSSEARLQLQDVRVRRDSFELSIDRWEIPSASINVLLGPTGSGKSTLIELMAGVQAANSGFFYSSSNREIDPRSLEHRRSIAWVAQKPRLIRGSVIDNVRLGLSLRDIRDRKLVANAIERWGLASIAHTSSRRLSGGQIQLVALARAWLCRPDILLLDEPTSNLDPIRVAMVERLIRETVQELGTAVIWSTHQVFQAKRLADRFAFLWNGRMIVAGDREQLHSAPLAEPLKSFLVGDIPS